MQRRARLVWTRPRSGASPACTCRAASGSAGSSTAPSRLLVLDLPPSIDEGEITDKGYINQRAVLERRAMHVEHLHAGGSGVIWAE